MMHLIDKTPAWQTRAELRMEAIRKIATPQEFAFIEDSSLLDEFLRGRLTAKEVVEEARAIFADPECRHLVADLIEGEAA